MYLASAHVHHFRNIDDLTVEFNQGLTVLVGENNIGKTNLIDAIRFALGPGSTGFRIPPQLSDVARNTNETSFSVDLRFEEISQEEMSSFIECLSYNAENPNESYLVIHYHWSWDERTQKYQERRTGGPIGNTTPIPSEVLQAIPFVYLEPLRDALATLTAGRSSRVGALMRRLRHTDENAKGRIERIIQDANEKLEEDVFVQEVIETIQTNIGSITSEHHAQTISLAAAAQKFENIVNSLSLVLQLEQSRNGNGSEVQEYAEIRENGLGYNNLLYIATILADLENCEVGDMPILCVEEPEAHLHPQLQLLLGEYFKRKTQAADSTVQVIVTTHSPNLVAHLPLEAMNVMHRPGDGNQTISAPMWHCGIVKREIRRIERLLDVTKASLLFARSVIFVEGVCEQLLLPGLARQAGFEIETRSISVIPVHGLSFATLSKLFGPKGLQLPCAIITDGDPDIINIDDPIHKDLPRTSPWLCKPILTPPDAVHSLPAETDKRAILPSSPVAVLSCKNTVTLEYDLALPGDNATEMIKVWRQSMANRVPELTIDRLNELSDSSSRATFVWQGLCNVSGGKYKAEYAQELADHLLTSSIGTFQVPEYICTALTHVGAGTPQPGANRVE